MNSKRGAVMIEAGGEKIPLTMGTNAMARYQDASGETVQVAFKSLESGEPDFVRIRRLFWAALPTDRGMTEDDAGDLIDELGLSEAVEKLGEAILLAFPEAKPGNAKSRKSKATS